MNKADLHRLVDDLPDAHTDAAGRILECLRSEKRDELSQALLETPDDPFLLALGAAPEDDEPETPEEAEAVRQGLADIAAGRVVSHEEAKRRLLGGA